MRGSLVLAVGLGLLPAFLVAAPAPELREYSAKVSDLARPGRLVPQDLVPDSMVTAVVQVLVFDEPIVVPSRGLESPTGYAEVDLCDAYWKTSMSGTPEEMLASFVPAERQTVARGMPSPETLVQFREHIRENSSDVEVLAIVYQSSSSSLLLWSHGHVFSQCFRRKSGVLYKSEKPENDLAIAITEAAFQKKMKSKQANH